MISCSQGEGITWKPNSSMNMGSASGKVSTTAKMMKHFSFFKSFSLVLEASRDASYPAFEIISTIFEVFNIESSNRMLAFSVARLTEAEVIPSFLFKAFSILFTHDAHVMPLIFTLIFFCIYFLSYLYINRFH